MIEQMKPIISEKFFKHHNSNNLPKVISNKENLFCMEYNLSKKLIDNERSYPNIYKEFNDKFLELITDFYQVIIVELFKQFYPTNFFEKLYFLNIDKTIEKSNYNIYLFNIFTKKFIINLRKIGIEIKIFELKTYEKFY